MRFGDYISHGRFFCVELCGCEGLNEDGDNRKIEGMKRYFIPEGESMNGKEGPAYTTLFWPLGDQRSDVPLLPRRGPVRMNCRAW